MILYINFNLFPKLEEIDNRIILSKLTFSLLLNFMWKKKKKKYKMLILIKLTKNYKRKRGVYKNPNWGYFVKEIKILIN